MGRMQFGDFTLKDNRYENNARGANRFIAGISTRRSSCTRRGWASIISRGWTCSPARSRACRNNGSSPRFRCCRCAIRSASPSRSTRPGRCSKRFWRSAAALVGRCTGDPPRGHHRFDDVTITPLPVQRPIPAYISASFSKPSTSVLIDPAGSATRCGGSRRQGLPRSLECRGEAT
jgi:hypothetical protein